MVFAVKVGSTWFSSQTGKSWQHHPGTSSTPEAMSEAYPAPQSPIPPLPILSWPITLVCLGRRRSQAQVPQAVVGQCLTVCSKPKCIFQATVLVTLGEWVSCPLPYLLTCPPKSRRIGKLGLTLFSSFTLHLLKTWQLVQNSSGKWCYSCSMSARDRLARAYE